MEGYLKPNSWKTQWLENGRLYYKVFKDNDSPKKAVDFGKELKARGIVVVDVISMRCAFPPPPKRAVAPSPGLLWCPYCVKWREFEESAVIDKDGLVGPQLLRCPTCRISVKHAYVRKYNPDLVIQYEMRQEMKARQKEVAKERRKIQKKYAVRGGIRKR